MNIGIDKIAFYTPSYFLNMTTLAKARNVDPNKFILGLGQDRMAVTPLYEDTVTLGANAALKILTDEDRASIDLVILGTESGIDQSKAGAAVIHSLLNITKFARVIEMKQACYAATGALQLAKAHVALNPDKKALVIASDISKYGLNSGGEPTQGAGAVAMIISCDPKIITIENDATYFSEDIHDFWRPNYSEYALVDGKYSNDQYQRFFLTVFQQNLEQYERSLEDFDALIFHIPYTKMGLKALRLIAEEEGHETLYRHFLDSTYYNRQVGNIYTGSLFLSLISLLEKGAMKAGERVGMYSYGSGAIGEFFSGIVQEGFEDHMVRDHQEMLDDRHELSIQAYETMFTQSLITDGSHQILNTQDASGFYLKEVKHHIRLYDKK